MVFQSRDMHEVLNSLGGTVEVAKVGVWLEFHELGHICTLYRIECQKLGHKWSSKSIDRGPKIGHDFSSKSGGMTIVPKIGAWIEF